MKNIQTAVLSMLILFLLGLFIWTLLPASDIVENYPVDLKQPLLENQLCLSPDTFNDLHVQLTYPNRIIAGDLAQLDIKVLNEIRTKDCSNSIEMSLELKSGFVFPQNRIIQAVKINSEQLFRFEIQPGMKSREIQGILWVYLITESDEEKTSERFPLLIIPLEIAIRSFFGIPLNWVRAFALVSAMVLLSIKVLIRKPG